MKKRFLERESEKSTVTTYSNNIINSNENNDNNSNEEDEEAFMRLIDEFIESQLGEESCDEAPTELPQLQENNCNLPKEEELANHPHPHTFHFGGKEYLLPMWSDERYRAESIGILRHDRHEHLLHGETVVITEKNEDCCSFNIMVRNINGLCNKKRENIRLYIYKRGNKRPIITKEIDEAIGYAYIKFENLLEELSMLKCDRYFFLLSNIVPESPDNNIRVIDNNSLIPFVIVPDGKECTTPPIQKIETYVTAEKSLELTMKFYNKVSTANGYTIYLYHNDYTLAGKSWASVWDGAKRHPGKSLTADVRCDHLTDGSYFALICHNNVAVYRLDFIIKDGKVQQEVQSKIRYMSPDYIIATELEHTYPWPMMREICGYTSAKELYARQCIHDKFNALRHSHRLPAIKRIGNFIYTGGSTRGEIDMLKRYIGCEEEINNIKSSSCISLCEAKNSIDQYEEATELFLDNRHYCIALYDLSALTSSSGSVVAEKMRAPLEDEYTIICLIGTPTEIEMLFKSYPWMRIHFPEGNRIERHSFTGDEITRHIIESIKSDNLVLTQEAEIKLSTDIQKGYEAGRFLNWNITDVKSHLYDVIRSRQFERTLPLAKESGDTLHDILSTIEVDDINCPTLQNNGEGSFEHSISMLNSMVGLEEVKRNFTTLFNRTRINEERRRMGLKVSNNECHHMIFTGNPGTGKTTVAKMVGKIYHSLGILSKGEVIWTERSKIVGRYIGDTENNMQRLLAEARGNVLFIDEAYTLCDNGHGERKDFGYRVIESLLTVMAQDNPDMIVIFAGYEAEMNIMMQSNQGLEGRFPYKFNFKDYSADELMQIAMQILEDEEYILDDEAKGLLHSTIEQSVKSKRRSFSNARWVEQYVSNGIKTAQCDRLSLSPTPKSRDDYRRIISEDIGRAFVTYKPQDNEEKRRPTIGFVA